jgi:uncharacterized protein YwqG
MVKQSKNRLTLPTSLEQYRDRLEATVKPYIEIQPRLTKKATLWQSKFAGLPYLPKGVDYPKTPQGDYLYLLAQINFSEVPNLEGFPRQGILQFYLAEDELYGKDFDNQTNQTGFRVLFFSEPEPDESKLVTDFDFLPSLWDRNEYYIPFQAKSNYSPDLSECFSLKFKQKLAPITLRDYHCKKLIGSDFLAEPDSDADESMEKKYYQTREEYFKRYEAGHRLGGYPFFSQRDPRSALSEDEGYILLLQIHNEHTRKIEVMWGDMGVCNFFIKPSSLAQLDFSDVLYCWECG